MLSLLQDLPWSLHCSSAYHTPLWGFTFKGDLCITIQSDCDEYQRGKNAGRKLGRYARGGEVGEEGQGGEEREN